MLTAIKNKIVHIKPEDVLSDAREEDLDVSSIEDFRDLGPDHEAIERMMEEYRSSFIKSSTVSGLTTGVGGFFTAMTFATVDTVTLSIQLYRLSQRFAILNGFDGTDSLQKDKMINIYFETLGLNAVVQAALKHQFLKAQVDAESWRGSDNMLLQLIIYTGKLLGKRLSSKQAGRLVPVFGGVVGATVNYSFAKKVSQKMKEAYKEAHYKTWR